MKQPASSVLELVSRLDANLKPGIDRAAIETLVGVRLERGEQSNETVTFANSKEDSAERALSVSLLVTPAGRFEGRQSALVLESHQKPCIGLAQVKSYFGALQLVQIPKGRSIEEVAVWSVQRQWGTLSFAFPEKDPACASRITFRSKI